MYHLNKLALAATMILATLNTFADDLDVKLNGQIEFTTGYFAPNGKKDLKNISNNGKNIAFNSSVSLGTKIENKVDNGITYGAQIGIHTTAKPARKHPSFLYLTSDYGKIQLGSTSTAMGQMKITGYSNATAVGNGWDIWPRLSPIYYSTPYMTGSGNYLDGKIRKSGETEYSRKITYYTPKFFGFQAGVSYVPDTSNLGFDSMDAHHTTDKPKIPGYNFAIKNGIAAGLTHDYTINNDIKLRTSLTGEQGKVVAYDSINNQRVTNIKFRNLSTYNIGALLTVRNTSFAGSYANHMKSFTSSQVHTLGTKTNLYSIGARQNFGKVAFSSTLFKSSHRRNDLTAGTLATEYKSTPGLLHYLQWTSYVTKGNYIDNNGAQQREKRKGQVIVLGSKIQF